MNDLKSQLLSMSAILLPLVCVVAGCGGGDGMTVSEDDIIIGRVAGLNDIAADKTAFAAAFVTGATPADAALYTTSAFQPVEAPSVSGDTATIKVKVISGIVDSQSGDESASQAAPAQRSETETTWTLERDGEDWKIKEAPLQ